MFPLQELKLISIEHRTEMKTYNIRKRNKANKYIYWKNKSENNLKRGHVLQHYLLMIVYCTKKIVLKAELKEKKNLLHLTLMICVFTHKNFFLVLLIVCL